MATKSTEPEARTHSNIYAALAAFQSEVPLMKKDSRANVQTKGGGSFSYSYAGLDVLVEQVVPLLGKQGIAWVCVPTLEDGRLVLRYGLHHGDSNTSVEGVYPLVNGSPQEIGSAISYARRYGLLSMTGTFPADEDDDGRAASDAYQHQQARQNSSQRESARQQPEQPAADAPLVADSARIDQVQTVEELRDLYREVAGAQQLDRILPTGEAIRDAINSRRAQIAAAEEALAAAGEEAMSQLGEPIGEEVEEAK